MKIVQKETNVGLIRKNNEDVVIEVKHPKDASIHLLLLADGMGGKDHGELAAKYVAEKIEKWFIKKTPKTFLNLEKVEDDLEKYINKINKEIIKKHGLDEVGTTLSMSIVTKKETLNINIGDSRIYIYKNNRLIQISEDDSDVWYYYKYGVVKKDDLRYFFNNNIITACVGLTEKLCRISSIIINNDYDMLMLFSDGVTDMITDKKIKKIIENTKKREILHSIIDEAVNVDQHLRIPLRLRIKKYSKYVLPFKGRDNASGVIYIK